MSGLFTAVLQYMTYFMWFLNICKCFINLSLLNLTVYNLISTTCITYPVFLFRSHIYCNKKFPVSTKFIQTEPDYGPRLTVAPEESHRTFYYHRTPNFEDILLDCEADANPAAVCKWYKQSSDRTEVVSKRWEDGHYRSVSDTKYCNGSSSKSVLLYS